MRGTLDDRYFEWLYGLVAAVSNRNPARSYWSLTRQLYTKEFLWFVPNDDNRAEDGKQLRYRFLDEHGIISVDPEWLSLGCSMLEMLISLAYRAEYESDRSFVEWFWIFVHHAGLESYNDRNYNDWAAKEIDKKLDKIIYRTYDRTGKGGLFPLQHTKYDQRKVELWYQKAEYLLEEYVP